jgi:hypothetical protein
MTTEKPSHGHYSMEGGGREKGTEVKEAMTAKIFLHRVQKQYKNQQFNNFEHIMFC